MNLVHDNYHITIHVVILYINLKLRFISNNFTCIPRAAAVATVYANLGDDAVVHALNETKVSFQK